MCCYRLPVVPPLGRSPSRGSEKKIRAEKNKKKQKKKERKKEIKKKDVSAPPEALRVRH